MENNEKEVLFSVSHLKKYSTGALKSSKKRFSISVFPSRLESGLIEPSGWTFSSRHLTWLFSILFEN